MNEPRRCPRCHAELSSDVAEGLCPECLYRQAIAVRETGPERDEAGRSPARTFVPPTPAELAPHFPQLEILRLLGQGGMGAVYLARQPELDRLLAVKILPPEVARDPGFTERFSREARSLARLSDPNIVTIFDFGTANGLYYFTMEYVAGKNVRELLDAGEMTPPLALRIVAQVCDALQHAHDEGFVHRDIKPENILLDSKGRVKIADFGLARLVGLTPTYLTLTGSQEVMGTLYYMAPEQLRRAHDVDHRADIYSLGVVFYEMLTGELPVGRFAPPSQRAAVDDRIDAIVLRALAREPEQRYQDAAQVKRDVEAALSGAPAPPSGAVPSWPCVRFTIPEISMAGAYVQGEVFRDATALILEYHVVTAWGSHKASRMLRIPLGEILMISCQASGRLSKSIGWKKAEIVLKVYRPELLDELPFGKLNRGRLLVHRADREEAQQLVASIHNSPLPAPARTGPGATVPGPADADRFLPPAGPDRVRRQLLFPALGLLLTGVGAVVSTAALAGLFTRELHQVKAAWGLAILGLVGIGTGFMMAGALQMLWRRSYLLSVAGALLALVPWSPAWLIGLPCGIWALVVLGRPEVVAAFLDRRRGVIPAPPPAPAPTGPVAGKLRSWLRSFAGYFVNTIPPRREDKSRTTDDEQVRGGPA
jgi:serine/threonine protein kinase